MATTEDAVSATVDPDFHRLKLWFGHHADV